MFRKLEYTDYNRGYLELLSQLTSVDNVSYDQFTNFVDKLNSDHQVWVYCVNNKILVTGTLVKEQKLIHGYSKYGHIEEIVVDNSLRGQGYGKRIVDFLVSQAKDCYRVNLNCIENLEEFYKKSGFSKKAIQMTYLIK
jgi:glucosamine-phosphate N-acetyltransferase